MSDIRESCFEENLIMFRKRKLLAYWNDIALRNEICFAEGYLCFDLAAQNYTRSLQEFNQIIPEI